jgi:HemY protein
MRRLFILVLVLLLGSVALVGMIQSDPGYVLLSYGRTTMEMSIWVGLALLLFFNLLFYLVVRGARKLWTGGGVLSGWVSDRRRNRGQRLTRLGLLSYLEGNWSRASRVLARSAPESEAPLVNYLVAARAAHQLRDPDQVEENLLGAEAEATGSPALALTRAELALDGCDYEAALDALQGLDTPGHSRAAYLRLLSRAQRGAGRWEELAGLLPQLRKQRVLDADEQAAWQREVHGELLSAAAAAATGDGGESLRSAWSACPAALRDDAELQGEYLSGLLAADQAEEVEKQLRRILKQSWDSGLVRLYGLTPGGDPARRLKVAEGWRQKHDDDAALHLTLGRLSLRSELWGQARERFEKSLELQPDPETAAELARLLGALGEEANGARYYRQGLELALPALPELPLPGGPSMQQAQSA